MFCSFSSSAGGSNILGFAGTPCVYMQYHLEFLFKITLGKKKKNIYYFGSCELFIKQCKETSELLI